MKTLSFYKYGTWILLLLNISLVAFFMFTKPSPPKGNLIKVLELDKSQNDAFLKSARAHHQQMSQISEQQATLLKPYFSSIVDATSNLDYEKNLNEVEKLERKKIESTYAHFQEVKSLLKKEQQENFKSFMDNAIKTILFEQNKKGHQRK